MAAAYLPSQNSLRFTLCKFTTILKKFKNVNYLSAEKVICFNGTLKTSNSTVRNGTDYTWTMYRDTDVNSL